MDKAVAVCRLQSLWSEAAAHPVNQSTGAMREVLGKLCGILGAVDASWLVMRRLDCSPPGQPERGQFDTVTEQMRGWVPVVGMYLNPDKVLKRVSERWYMHARKNGVDPITVELLKSTGVTRACIREDVVTEKQWAEHWLARSFLSYYGVGERMVGVVPHSEDSECVVVLDRPLKAKPYTQGDKQFFLHAIGGLRRLHRNLSLEHGAIHASSPLSKRERETYRQLLTSRSEAEIAEQMGLSSHTIHDYARKLYRKFNVKGRTGLMALVLGSE